MLIFLSLVACGKKEDPTYKAGSYTATGYNKENPVEVEVGLSDQKIESVKVLKHGETEGIGTVAVEKLPAQIVEKKSAEVDGIASATVTSGAILEAVKSILAENAIGEVKGGNETGKKKEVLAHFFFCGVYRFGANFEEI